MTLFCSIVEITLFVWGLTNVIRFNLAGREQIRIIFAGILLVGDAGCTGLMIDKEVNAQPLFNRYWHFTQFTDQERG